MQLTVRLPEEDMAKLMNIAGRLGLKRSEVTRLAIRKFLAEFEEDEYRPYDRIKHLLGVVESGKKDLGSAHREHIIRKIKGET